MKTFWVGLKLDLKQIFADYLKLILFVVSVVLLSLAISIAGSQILYDDVSVEPFNLAIVDREDSQWTHMIIDAVKQMETVTRLCKIQVIEENRAKAKLESGEVIAIVTIPEHFVNDVMTGKNTPLVIEKKEGTILENVVVDKLITSATKLLSAAQVGIYSTLDHYRLYGNDQGESYNQLLQEVNLVFAKKMLARNKMFLEKEMVATGSLAPLGHYLLSGFVIMMTLSLMLTIHIMEPLSQKEMLMRYKVAKMKGSFILLQKWATLTLFNVLFGGLCLGSIALCSKQMGLDMNWTLNGKGIIGVLLAFGSLSAMGLLIGMLLKSSEVYGLFLFLIALVQAFLSGGLIPSAFMPEFINKLGYLTYNKYGVNLLGNLIGVDSPVSCYVGASLILVGSLFLGCMLIRKRGISI